MPNTRMQPEEALDLLSHPETSLLSRFLQMSARPVATDHAEKDLLTSLALVLRSAGRSS